MEYSSLQPASPLLELTSYTGSQSVTCHSAEVTFLPYFSQPRLVLDLATWRDARPSLPSWLVTYQDGIPARRRWSPIPILTRVNVE